jgi:hypothetical protein
VKKQADSIAVELDQMRATNTDRADRISRYVDDKVAQILGDPSHARVAAETAALEERLDSLKSAAEAQARLAETSIAVVTEDIRNQIRQAQDLWAREAASAKRESDRSTKVTERQVLAQQEELKARFEAYRKHFDDSIAKVQAAILRPSPPAAAQGSPRPSPQQNRSPMKDLQIGRSAGYSGMPHASPHAPSAAGFNASPGAREYWRPAAEWQSEEMRCVVDGLRVHDEPDMASQVRGSLSRGESVVVKDIFEQDRRRWASLGGRGGRGGFVLFLSEYGTPLLETIATVNVSRDLFAMGGPLSPTVPAGPPGPAADAYLSPPGPGQQGVAESGWQAASSSQGRVLGPLVPLTSAGESVQKLAEEVASNACNLDVDSEEGVDMRNMVRNLLVQGVVSGDFGRALEEEATSPKDADGPRPLQSAESVLSPQASVASRQSVEDAQDEGV